MSRCIVLFFIVAVICFTQARKLPSYMTMCKKSDPELNKCALNSAQKSLQSLFQGDKDFKIPSFLPVKLDEVTLNANENLKIKFTKIVASGLDKAEIRGINVDIRKNQWDGVLYVPRLDFEMIYDINGRILILPINGNGPANVTFDEPTFHFSMVVENFDKGGVQYYKIKEAKITYKLKRMYIQLDNLFNGDPKLGPEMNSFLNENWSEVEKEIYPVLTETLKMIATNVFSNIFKLVPADEVLAP